jgi:hypothetical protein
MNCRTPDATAAARSTNRRPLVPVDSTLAPPYVSEDRPPRPRKRAVLMPWPATPPRRCDGSAVRAWLLTFVAAVIATAFITALALAGGRWDRCGSPPPLIERSNPAGLQRDGDPREEGIDVDVKSSRG